MKRTRGEGVSHEGFLDYLDSKIPDAIKKIRDEKDEETLIAQLQAENESLWALAEFGRKCFESHRDGLNDLDGDDLQKWALEFGLLKGSEVFAPCNSDPDVGCWCREYHGEFPCICIKSTDLAQLPEKRE